MTRQVAHSFGGVDGECKPVISIQLMASHSPEQSGYRSSLVGRLVGGYSLYHFSKPIEALTVSLTQTSAQGYLNTFNTVRNSEYSGYAFVNVERL